MKVTKKYVGVWANSRSKIRKITADGLVLEWNGSTWKNSAYPVLAAMDQIDRGEWTRCSRPSKPQPRGLPTFTYRCSRCGHAWSWGHPAARPDPTCPKCDRMHSGVLVPDPLAAAKDAVVKAAVR